MSKPDFQRIFIAKLTVTDFRNLAKASLAADQRHVVLAGPNGAGKTNLLEAVSFLAPGRGLRRASYGDIAREGGPGTWAVHAELASPAGSSEIGTGLIAPDDRQRRIRIDGAAAPTSESLAELVRVTWLTPAMDGLFTGSPGDRRRFVARMVLAADPAHGRRVSAFEKSMRSRNKLLEASNPDRSWLDGVEQQMAELAIAVAAARRGLVDRLAGEIDAAAEPALFPVADLKLAGTPEDALGEAPAAEVEDAYQASLRDNRHRDAAAGRTLVGPHRSDLIVFDRMKAMPAGQCSTGEQKALLIGLVLAHARLVAKSAGLAPILLLDEVAAHLDPDRRAALFDRLDRIGGQAWMTGTEWPPFDTLGARGQRFAVADGTLAPA